MRINVRKKLLVGGLAVSLTFGGLAGCGNVADDDIKKEATDAVKAAEEKLIETKENVEKKIDDNDLDQKATDAVKAAEEKLIEAKEEVEKGLEDKGIGDGVDN
ncbi:MAG: hypothetical protein K6T88_08600 [Bacillus sp. (in: Bacteria)]|nr:hypothetical protein [Bacillus sp. (in: firmicutes)]